MLKMPHRVFATEMKLWMLYSAQSWLDSFESNAIGSGNMDPKESERIIKNWIKSSGYSDISIPSKAPASISPPSSTAKAPPSKSEETKVPGGKKEKSSFSPMRSGFDGMLGAI
jgi:hypothetical protein